MKHLHIWHQEYSKHSGWKEPIEQMHFNFADENRAGEALHSHFNYEAGDVYAFPANNITPEEINKLYLEGQRAFLLVYHYNQTLVRMEVIDGEKEKEIFAKWEKTREEKKFNKIAHEIIDDVECEIRNVENGHQSKEEFCESIKEVYKYYMKK